MAKSATNSAVSPPALGCEGSPKVDPPFHDFLPIEWVHIPKTGTSFLDTLTHLPGACPCCPANLRDYGVFEPGCCNAKVFDTRFFVDAVHPGIEDLPGGFEAGKGRFMTFMRQPEQRFLSMVHYVVDGNDTETITKPDMTLDDKKVFFAGWATKMLVRGGKRLPLSSHDSTFLERHIDLTKPARFKRVPYEPLVGTAWESFNQDYGGWLFPLSVSQDEVEEAKMRLRTGFSFIGMTEKWELSICLFNVMLNQTCCADQFLNFRPTYGNHQTTYDTAVLNGWRDPYDNELFNVATEVFEANLKRYNVSEVSCQRCWREAGVR
uniref:Uncharacterized protein n=1 Tax=Pyrodinium bahamense TaxID=73915 RepID=A0A7R9ZZP0_9DINO